MNLLVSARFYRLLCRIWALSLASLALVLGARVIAQNLDDWRTADRDQAGQLSLYNDAPDGGFLGLPVELGDLDGDGFVDIIIAPMNAPSGPDDSRSAGGRVYIYPGDGQISGIVDRSALSPDKRGITLWGERSHDLLGTELFAADIDGDGIEDLLVGAQNYDGPDGSRDNAGGAYILFGRKDLFSESRTIDLADRQPQDGITRIVGSEPGERCGIWIEAGNLDGDPAKDLVIGADQFPAATAEPLNRRGKTYVIYGRDRKDFPAEIDLATFTEDVSVLLGKDRGDHFGASIHARDLNSDGLDELIVAAALNRLSASISGVSDFAPQQGSGDGPGNARPGCGEAYVFFGNQGPEGGGRLPTLVDLSQPLPKALEGRITVIYGDGLPGRTGDAAGEEITSGDFNGDGFPDLVLGALTGTPPGGAIAPNAGRAYVIYWREGLEGIEIDVAVDPIIPRPKDLHVSTLYSLDRSDILGDTLSAADFNHDGFDDLAVGIPNDDPDGMRDAGSVALVFGSPEFLPEIWTAQPPTFRPEGVQLSFVFGHRAGDLLSYSMEARDYDLDGYADLYPNAMRGEVNRTPSTDAGAAYLISGYRLSGASLTVATVRPRSGPPDTEVEIRGSGFTTDRDTEVRLSNTVVEDFEVVSGTSIRARLPASAGLKVDLALTVSTRYGTATLEHAFRFVEPGEFRRADANFDGSFDLSDPVRILNTLFLGVEMSCADASDANDDGDVNLADAIYTLDFLFRGGTPPRAPYPEIGTDPTVDKLDCSF